MTDQVRQMICIQGLNKLNLHLKYFDLHPTRAPSRVPAINTKALFLLPLFKTAHQLLHVPPSFTPRNEKRSPQPSVTAPKVSAKRAGEKRHNIFSNRSTFPSLQEADGVVVNSSAILNSMQMSEDDKKNNMLKSA